MKQYLFGFIVFLFATTILATPHSMYFNGNSDRIGVFFSESASLEYGNHTLESSTKTITSKWYGTGINTEFGLELEKFIQFSLNHTFLNLQDANNAAKNMKGFRLAPELKAIFSSPAFNLEFGMGATASKFDYQECSALTNVQGYGSFFSIGATHYFARHVAAFLVARKILENFDKVNGDLDIKSLHTDGYASNLGIRIDF